MGDTGEELMLGTDAWESCVSTQRPGKRSIKKERGESGAHFMEG